MITHTLSVAGLVLNGMGAFILVFSPSTIREVTEDGRKKYPITRAYELPSGDVTKTKSWRYYWQLWGFRIGAGFLFGGFLFQLAAELRM